MHQSRTIASSYDAGRLAKIRLKMAATVKSGSQDLWRFSAFAVATSLPWAELYRLQPA
jgi:hypothetical protein